MPSLLRVLAGTFGFLAGATVLLAAKNNLPTRDTPVPADQPVPLVDFARPVLFEDPELNPSGTYFAALTKNERLETSLLICELATGKVSWSKSGVRTFSWIDDQHIQLNDQVNGVITVDNPQRQLLITNLLPTGNRGLIRETGFLWAWPLADKPTLSGRVTRVWPGLEDGRPLYCTTTQQDWHKYLYRWEGRSWAECPVDLDEITPVALGDKPGEMLVIGPATKGSPRALQRLDTVSGQLGEVLYRDPKYDCQPDVFLQRGTSRVLGVSVGGKTGRTAWLDSHMQEIQDLVDRQFSGLVAEIVSADLKENRFLIKTESDQQPPVYHLLDYAGKSLALVKPVAPWFDPARLARTQIIDYQTRDGATIDAFLTLPPGASREHPVPLVVDLHGGPWQYRNLWRFDNDAQFFASRGYAVLKPNYRGSLGYDSRFDPADRFDFQKMTNDIADGVSALAKSGLIDPKHVAVRGIGFGAYLALSCATDAPELFRGVILFGGIFDWEKQFRKKDSPARLEEAWVERRLAEFKLAPPAPLARKDRLHVPVFFARNTWVRDITLDTQIFELYLDLKGQVPCEFIGDLNLQTENEAFDEAVDRLGLMEEFLHKHLAPN